MKVAQEKRSIARQFVSRVRELTSVNDRVRKQINAASERFNKRDRSKEFAWRP